MYGFWATFDTDHKGFDSEWFAWKVPNQVELSLDRLLAAEEVLEHMLNSWSENLDREAIRYTLSLIKLEIRSLQSGDTHNPIRSLIDWARLALKRVH